MIFTLEQMKEKLNKGEIIMPKLKWSINALDTYPYWVSADIGKVTDPRYVDSDDHEHYYWDTIDRTGSCFGYVAATSEEDAIIKNGEINNL